MVALNSLSMEGAGGKSDVRGAAGPNSAAPARLPGLAPRAHWPVPLPLAGALPLRGAQLRPPGALTGARASDRQEL